MLSDETYSKMYYLGGEGEVAPSIASLPGMAERTLVVGTFSKSYAMDGWRLGWVVAPPALAPAVAKVMYYASSCSPTFTQHAAVEALEADQACVAAMRADYITRRRIIVEGLRAIPGVELAEPGGAFYAFPRIPGFRPDFPARLLEEYGVAAVDGSEFGASGEGHIRIAYSCSQAECERGVERLAAALGA